MYIEDFMNLLNEKNAKIFYYIVSFILFLCIIIPLLILTLNVQKSYKNGMNGYLKQEDKAIVIDVKEIESKENSNEQSFEFTVRYNYNGQNYESTLIDAPMLVNGLDSIGDEVSIMINKDDPSIIKDSYMITILQVISYILSGIVILAIIAILKVLFSIFKIIFFNLTKKKRKYEAYVESFYYDKEKRCDMLVCKLLSTESNKLNNEDILKIPFQQNYDIESILERYIAFTITGSGQINIEIIN